MGSDADKNMTYKNEQDTFLQVLFHLLLKLDKVINYQTGNSIYRSTSFDYLSAEQHACAAVGVGGNETIGLVRVSPGGACDRL